MIGLPSGASAQSSLHAGTCAVPSAAAAMLPSLTSGSTGKASATGMVLFRGEENVAFSTVADGDHIIRITSGDRVVSCGVIPAVAASSLDTNLLAEGESHQVIQFNPDAALQKRIFADGYVPNSSEFRLVSDDADYIAQRAEHLGSGSVRVYHVLAGDRANVQFVERGAGGPASASQLRGKQSSRLIGSGTTEKRLHQALPTGSPIWCLRAFSATYSLPSCQASSGAIRSTLRSGEFWEESKWPPSGGSYLKRARSRISLGPPGRRQPRASDSGHGVSGVVVASMPGYARFISSSQFSHDLIRVVSKLFAIPANLLP